MPWRAQLQNNVFEYINNLPNHHEHWQKTDIKRGSYFHHPNAPQYLGHEFPACHFFIANYQKRVHGFHCAAKMEPIALGADLQWLVDFFNAHPHQPPAIDGGVEIGWVEIVHPPNFNAAIPDQALPPALWNDILEQFLQSQTIIDFIDIWEHH